MKKAGFPALLLIFIFSADKAVKVLDIHIFRYQLPMISTAKQLLMTSMIRCKSKYRIMACPVFFYGIMNLTECSHVFADCLQ